MFAGRLGLAAVRNAAAASSVVGSLQQARTMATLKELKLRISSTKNIQKITKSMKMIASTKLVRAQRDMEKARVYGSASAALYTNAHTNTEAATGEKQLIIATSSDKGLCGGIHSSVTRKIRAMAKVNPNMDIIVIGDKAKAQLTRTLSSKIVGSFAAVGSKPPIFLDALMIGNVILRSPTPYASTTIIFNKFKSAIQFDTIEKPVHSMPQLMSSEKIDAYEVEDDVLQSLQEFNLVNSIFATMADGYAAEIAAKMSAMENATNNAGDLIGKLTIVYNRSRQAAITTELVDIITGASAL